MARTEDTAFPEVRRGEWLWTTRQGAENDLVQEVGLLEGKARARRLAPGLVVTDPLRSGAELAFARQGFPVDFVSSASDLGALTGSLSESLLQSVPGAPEYLLHVWVPDTDAGNPLSARARLLEEALERRMSERRPEARRVEPATATGSVPYAQVCVATGAATYAGVLPSHAAPSLAPGGRTRTRAPSGKPSRSARKLEEAFAWLGTSPGPGDVCVDLGAAPGGWSYVLLERRAKVVAVDPARLRPDLLRRKGLVHVQRSAFDFRPEEPVDWLFCDMAWRPLEVAAMLGRWARQRWATLLVANFKLPMKQKADMVVRLRRALEQSGWQSVKARQLYHDRDEITVTAHR